jgi:hypothetical protein
MADTDATASNDPGQANGECTDRERVERASIWVSVGKEGRES